MRMTWISVGIVASALVAFTACGNSTTGAGGSGSGGNGAGGGVGGNGSGGGTGGGSGTSCMTCACTDLMSAGGCADLCDDMQNGNPGTPNFCNAASALPQCSACIISKCGVADPTACN